MPPSIGQSKRRVSLAEHEAVLSALAAVVRLRKTTVASPLREWARRVIRSRSADSLNMESLRQTVWSYAPKMPTRFKSAAQAALFKRAQRDFDTIVQDLKLARPETVQQRNSVTRDRAAVQVLAFADVVSQSEKCPASHGQRLAPATKVTLRREPIHSPKMVRNPSTKKPRL